jgi:hypothetical protein
LNLNLNKQNLSNQVTENMSVNNFKINSEKICEKNSEISLKKENSYKNEKPENKIFNKKKRNRTKSTDSEKKNSSMNFNEISSFSQSENEAFKKGIFKTFKTSRQNDSQIEMKKMMRLMKNRLSARKCRQKKKIYLGRLEQEMNELKSELERYKAMEKKEKNIENMIKMVKKMN